MNPMLIAALAGTAMGGLSYLDDKKESDRAEKERKKLLKVEKERQRYSYWTGDKGEVPGMVAKPSLLKELMKGAATGASFGQGLDGAWGSEAPAGNQYATPTYTPGQGEPPYASGDMPPQAQLDMGRYNAPWRPEHSIDNLSSTAQGRRVSSPGAVGNY